VEEGRSNSSCQASSLTSSSETKQALLHAKQLGDGNYGPWSAFELGCLQGKWCALNRALGFGWERSDPHRIDMPSAHSPGPGPSFWGGRSPSENHVLL
jgi:hypothetical protein